MVRSRKPTRKPTRKAKAAQSTENTSVLAVLERWLTSQELDQLGDVRAAQGRALAAKLDQVRRADASAAEMAAPGISKELREVLDAIQEASDDSAEFVTGLFAEVGDSAKS